MSRRSEKSHWIPATFSFRSRITKKETIHELDSRELKYLIFGGVYFRVIFNVRNTYRFYFKRFRGVSRRF